MFVARGRQGIIYRVLVLILVGVGIRKGGFFDGRPFGVVCVLSAMALLLWWWWQRRAEAESGPEGGASRDDERLRSVFGRPPGSTAEKLAACDEGESGRAEVGSEGDQLPADGTGQRDR